MIVLNLHCDQGHHFEGWFASSAAFDEQSERGLVQCALCASLLVSRLPSSPRVRRSVASDAASKDAIAGQAEPELAAKVFQALAALARQAEDVGGRFPEEARRMHYEEAPARAIRGQASREETRELLDEGILVLPVPVPPANETH